MFFSLFWCYTTSFVSVHFLIWCLILVLKTNRWFQDLSSLLAGLTHILSIIVCQILHNFYCSIRSICSDVQCSQQSMFYANHGTVSSLCKAQTQRSASIGPLLKCAEQPGLAQPGPKTSSRSFSRVPAMQTFDLLCPRVCIKRKI